MKYADEQLKEWTDKEGVSHYTIPNQALVESTQIKRVGYDPGNRIMYVEFCRGSSLYEYRDVPIELYESLRDAQSPGKYFHANIKGTIKGIPIICNTKKQKE